MTFLLIYSKELYFSRKGNWNNEHIHDVQSTKCSALGECAEKRKRGEMARVPSQAETEKNSKYNNTDKNGLFGWYLCSGKCHKMKAGNRYHSPLASLSQKKKRARLEIGGMRPIQMLIALSHRK